MVRICKNCGFENQDSYDFCAKCGTPLVEGLQPNTFFVYRNVEQGISRKFIIISYIITIFFSFGGFLMDLEILQWVFLASLDFSCRFS